MCGGILLFNFHLIHFGVSPEWVNWFNQSSTMCHSDTLFISSWFCTAKQEVNLTPPRFCWTNFLKLAKKDATLNIDSSWNASS